MKQFWVTFSIACLAITSSANADTWGRSVPNRYVSQNQQKSAAVQAPMSGSPVIQAPSAISSSPVQYDGYPFTEGCGGGGGGGCCSNVWSGYSKHCGCGLGHGLFGHWKHGCGLFHHAHFCGPTASMCGSCCSSGFGGCFNSFGGGGCCNTESCGLGSHLGHKLHALCGCGLHHKLGALRGMCGVTCDTGCSTGCASTAVSGGCSSCAGHSHQGGVYPQGKGQIVHPPAPPAEPTPAADELPPAPENVEKSAFRYPKASTYRVRNGF